MAVNYFLVGALLKHVKNHAITDLLGRPAVLQAGQNVRAQLYMSDQLVLCGPGSLRINGSP